MVRIFKDINTTNTDKDLLGKTDNSFVQISEMKLDGLFRTEGLKEVEIKF